MEGQTIEGYSDIHIPPELLKHYAHSTKNAIVLHLAIKSIACEGKVKRNINSLAVSLGRCPKRLREAESRLKRCGLLRVHLISNQRWWYIYDKPIGSTSTDDTDEAIPTPTPVSLEIEPPKRQGFWRKIRDAIIGTL